MHSIWPTLTLKRALEGAGKRAESLHAPGSFPDQDGRRREYGDLLKQYLESGQPEKAAALAEKVLCGGTKNLFAVHQVAIVLVEASDFDVRRRCARSSATQ